MDFGHLLQKLYAVIRPFWHEPKGRWVLLGSLCALAFAEICQAVLYHHHPDLWLWGELTIIPVTLLLSLILGSQVHEPVPPRNIERFFVKEAAELYRVNPSSAESICHLLTDIATPQPEGSYIGSVTGTIEKSSVWAICGRKSDKYVDVFWDANRTSKKHGNYIERVFFPPGPDEEIRAVIDDHIRKEMLVRLFPKWDAEIARTTWGFPPGFGMTLMGEPGKKHAGVCDPTNLTQVLIHWGGVEVKDPHWGVVVKDPLWIEHFWALYMIVRIATHVANGLTPREFRTKYRHYRR